MDKKSSQNSESSDDLSINTHFRKQSFLAEIFDFIRHGKRWWLVPILLILGLLALFALLAGVAPVMPFIYTLF